MAIADAKKLFSFAWKQYKSGSRGRDLWNNAQRFAKSEAFPTAYTNPLHGLKELAKAGVLNESD